MNEHLSSNSNKYFEPLISTVEAAQSLRVHPKTLLRMARDGDVPSVRVSKRRVAFRYSQLDLWLNSRYTQSVTRVA